jgi:hypothetical protein
MLDRKLIVIACLAGLPLMTAGAARADVTVLTTEPVVTQTRTVVVHEPTFIKEVTTEQPVVVAPSLDAVSRRQIILSERTVPTTSTVILKQSGVPDFSHRLVLMNEQINLGLSNGWLTSFRADQLKIRVHSLIHDVNNLTASDFANGSSDRIEREANRLNIEISDSMKNAPSIGSTGLTR